MPSWSLRRRGCLSRAELTTSQRAKHQHRYVTAGQGECGPGVEISFYCLTDAVPNHFSVVLCHSYFVPLRPQVALDQAAFLLDMAAAETRWDGDLLRQLAALYEEAGVDDMAAFLQEGL